LDEAGTEVNVELYQWRIANCLEAVDLLRLSILISVLTVANRWDENAGLRRDAIRSQVIDALEAQEIKETGNEED
jgi:hypothetical protein